MNILINSIIAIALTTGLMQSHAVAGDNGTNVYRCMQYSEDFRSHIWKLKAFQSEAPTAEAFMETESAKALDLRKCKVWVIEDNGTHWEW
ncbi:hypothetical protein [Pseudomonas sp. NPDC089741]|uniref:hypothetical protein n=1 Tax=Pseudomonas sp. NPDC089741 TaxID=3364470 RepID=UPI003811ED6C